MHDETASLVTRLLAQRWLPRDDAQARKALLDEAGANVTAFAHFEVGAV